MLILENFVRISIYILMGLGILAAISAVTMKNLFHSGLALAGVLISVAGIYLSVGAEFLAMVQILVYVGAIMTLVIYAIMLTEKLGAQSVQKKNTQSIPAAAACAAFVGLLGLIYLRAVWPLRQNISAERFASRSLGEKLMTEYLLPFEVLGVLLFAVLIGAIVIARKDKA